MAVRGDRAYPRSSRQGRAVLAERGIDGSQHTVAKWVQTFGPQLAAEVRCRRRPVGRCGMVDEVVLFRKHQQRSLSRTSEDDGVVVDVLLREHRETASAEACFRQAIERTGVIPDEGVTDHHQPSSKACVGLHARASSAMKPIAR